MKKITCNKKITIIIFIFIIAIAAMLITVLTIINNSLNNTVQQQPPLHITQPNFTCDKNICIFEIKNNYEYCSYIKDTRKNEILKIDCYKK